MIFFPFPPLFYAALFHLSNRRVSKGAIVEIVFQNRVPNGGNFSSRVTISRYVIAGCNARRDSRISPAPFPRMHVRAPVFARHVSTGVSFAPPRPLTDHILREPRLHSFSRFSPFSRHRFLGSCTSVRERV